MRKARNPVRVDLSSVDKAYFLDAKSISKVRAKGSLLVILGVGSLGIMFSAFPWWVKGLFVLGLLFLAMLSYYDMKYIVGLQKNPFTLSFQDKKFQYFNEFEGNKFINTDKIREVKVYSRAKERHLLEVFLSDSNKEENVNISGFDEVTKDEILADLAKANPKITFTSNREIKEDRHKKSRR